MKVCALSLNHHDSVINELIYPLDYFNYYRLYWVWISSTINLTLSLLKSSTAQHALNIMSSISFYTGIISWALYYARFSLHLSLFIKNTVNGPWLTDEEKNLPWWNLSFYERLSCEWDDKKYNLLNDLLWATCNLMCYFWFKGPGILGHLGSVLTIAFLTFDLIVAYSIYNKKFDEHIEKIATLSGDEREQCELDWKYEQYKMYNNIAYSAALLIAFTLLTLPFVPVSLPSIIIVALTGAALCLAFTLIRDVIHYEIDNAKQEEKDKKLNGSTHKLSESGKFTFFSKPAEQIDESQEMNLDFSMA